MKLGSPEEKVCQTRNVFSMVIHDPDESRSLLQQIRAILQDKSENSEQRRIEMTVLFNYYNENRTVRERFFKLLHAHDPEILRELISYGLKSRR